MRDIDELIEQARTADDTEPAVRALVAAGPEALREVLRVAGEESWSFEPALYEVIRRSTYPQAVPVLMAHAESDSAAAGESIFAALSASGEPAARAFLIERLRDIDALPDDRAAAAKAMFGLAGSDVVSALRVVLAEQSETPDDAEWPRLLVNVASALATLGDHRGAPALYQVLTTEYDSARSLAAGALRIVLDGESFHQLTRAAADVSAEVRRAVVDPVFLIGAPASAELLLQFATRDSDDEVRHNSVIRLGDIMGLTLGGVEDLPLAETRWQEVRATLDPRTCYRVGAPVSSERLVDEFSEKDLRRSSIAEELQIITGIDVPSIHVAEGIDGVRAAMASIDLAAGRIHKWGHPQEMPDLP